MKFTVIFFVVAALTIGVLTDGDAEQLGSKEERLWKRSLHSSIAKRSDVEGTDIDYEEDIKGDNGNRYVLRALRVIFEQPEWRDLMIMLATEKELHDKEFIKKWHVTKALIDANTETDEGDDNSEENLKSKAMMAKLLRTKKWRALIALSSSKSELVNPEYRLKWGLGDLPDNVRHSSETESFFDGPQWKEFLAVIGTKKDLSDPEIRAAWFKKWLLNAMDMFATME